MADVIVTTKDKLKREKAKAAAEELFAQMSPRMKQMFKVYAIKDRIIVERVLPSERS